MGAELKEVVWPPIGFIYDQEFMLPAFCKPKLCPLKSITLEKLEKMQRESAEKLKELERAEAEAAANMEKSNSNETSSTNEIKGNIKTEIWQADENN